MLIGYRSIKVIVVAACAGFTASLNAAVIPVTPENTTTAWERSLLTATTRGTEAAPAFTVGESGVNDN